MTILSWLVLLEIIVGFGLIVWLVSRARRHVSHSPAEDALKRHLAELEAAKLQKQHQADVVAQKENQQ